MRERKRDQIIYIWPGVLIIDVSGCIVERNRPRVSFGSMRTLYYIHPRRTV